MPESSLPLRSRFAHLPVIKGKQDKVQDIAKESPQTGTEILPRNGSQRQARNQVMATESSHTCQTRRYETVMPKICPGICGFASLAFVGIRFRNTIPLTFDSLRSNTIRNAGGPGLELEHALMAFP